MSDAILGRTMDRRQERLSICHNSLLARNREVPTKIENQGKRPFNPPAYLLSLLVWLLVSLYRSSQEARPRANVVHELNWPHHLQFKSSHFFTMAPDCSVVHGEEYVAPIFQGVNYQLSVTFIW